MPGPFLHRQLLPILVVFLTVLAISAGAEGQDRVDSSPGNEAGDAVQPAAAFPMGRIDPVPVEPDYDPLFDDYDEAPEESEIYDPFEPGNRAVYGFNRQVDRFVFNPVTKGYRTVVPDFARRSIRRAFLNLNAPIYVMNNLFQLRLLDAVQTVGAFAMNMTFGFGGLFETGDGIRCELKHADFGQTLALYGVGPGPYLVIPVLGPTTTRDGIGWVIDRGFHPLTYVLGIPIQLMWGGGHGVSYRAEVAEGMAVLEESALDPYAVMRSAYTQARGQAIEEARKQQAGRSSESEEDAIARVPES